VEKKEPPIIVIRKKINQRFFGELDKDIPIFDILLVKEKIIEEKL